MSVEFDDSFTLGKTIYSTDTFEHQHYSEFLDMYDANYIKFKQPISLKEFKKTEKYLKDFHQKNGQTHLKFKFPKNITFSDELNTYLQQEKYDIDSLELFKLKKTNFPSLSQSTDIDIDLVTLNHLDDLLILRFNLNKEYGKDYAHRKNDLIKEHLQPSNIQFLIAYYKKIPAGCVNVISTDSTLEIDDLYVHEDFRNKQIASFLQGKVIEMAQDKEVILQADGNDTPREMYLKQGYELQSNRFEIFKLFS
ncbi:GNAT family N-acetyltransferase [Vagococcus fluvialis]|uniref:GNAT family N-acetyltransferase n=1 Tax=Vagococcus fluvialis TaxID=2738 RepID=UPI002033206C|nr:GNAT family N-acetyltransferase [Vagococcus fluvialis]MCM2138364.1 GNAT family N-acetyltransferase [Vagococcus fluvialis]